MGCKGDLPTKAPAYTPPVALSTSWSGFYVGLNAGGVWSDTDMDWRLNPVGFGPSGVHHLTENIARIGLNYSFWSSAN